MADQPIFYPHGQQNNVGDSFMRAFMTGLQIRQQQQAEEAAREERKLRIEALQQEAKRLKLADKMEAFKFLQGQKAAPEMAEAPNLFSPGGQMPTFQEGQHPEFDFSEDLGVPGVKARPQNMTDMLAEQMLRRRQELEAKVAEAEAMEGAKMRAQTQPVTSEVSGVGPVTAPASALQTVIGQLFGQQGAEADRTFKAGESDEERAFRAAEAEKGRRFTAGQNAADRALRGQEKPKGLSAEAAIKLSTVESLERELGTIQSRLTGDGEAPIGGLAFRMRAAGAVSGYDASLTKSVKNAADLLGRLRSQGAISKNEEARFKDLILSWKDMIRGDPQAVRDSIASLRQEARGISSRIQPNGSQPGADPLGLFK